ncbi:MAG TPA: hypothetical protein VH309_10230 [Elusimicrobiota bacterium]|jgi:hypothetical protein|nr:hypothetical protein [Elusimicrobiota bacterium]
MANRSFFSRLVAIAALIVLVATPLASWAAARSPIFIAPVISSSHRRAPLPSVQRHAHRHRREGIARRARASRAFAGGSPAPEAGLVSGLDGRLSAPVDSDLPPPEYPPA